MFARPFHDSAQSIVPILDGEFVEHECIQMENQSAVPIVEEREERNKSEESQWEWDTCREGEWEGYLDRDNTRALGCNHS